MRWIVLPFTIASAVYTVAAVYVIAITAIDVGISIEVVIGVDIYVIAAPAAAPTPAAAPRSTHRQPHAEGDRPGCNYGSCSIIWRIINWWVRIANCTICIYRIIRRNVNHLWVSLFDHDH